VEVIYILSQGRFRSKKIRNGTKLKLRLQLVFTYEPATGSLSGCLAAKDRRFSRPFYRNIYYFR